MYFGWDNDCRSRSGFISTFLSINLNQFNKYQLILEGENIPKLVNIYFNGNYYKNYDWKNNYINFKTKPHSNNFNLIIIGIEKNTRYDFLTIK